MAISANYHEYKIEVKATVPGSLSSFIYAYCKTINFPESLEPHFIRKAISFVKLSKYVRENITSDFDCWYRKNENSQNLNEVLATMINASDCRNQYYFPKSPFGVPSAKTESFTLAGYPVSMVLVQKVA